ncbi:dual-specificity RNA methyltransferase RlmN [Macadamia integrifolia]|uniref:dual-specificity RNA methyltransferase RlmN n=1 Tax=Macadamia integrifolia TaxID=60698 RepID=UPI001C4F9B5E|nr:dual-specificity RNA methyltransferase RlmN [Macadamia integrifolia]
MELSRIWMRQARPHCFCLVVTNPALASTAPTTSLSVPFSKLHLTSLFSPSRRSISKTSSSYAPIVHVHGSDSAIANNNSNPNPSKVLLKGMIYDELENWVKSHGYRPGQALMLWKRLYGNNIWAHCVDELEGLNKDLRKMLGVFAEFKALSLKKILTAADGTRKILFTLDDGLVIETVVIPCKRERTTVCVSSQVGCAMNCQFCYTGRMGLRRHLTAAEIVEQAVFARRLLSSEIGSITNVVFMGMGEPLHNIENVTKAAAIMVDEQGLHFSPRRVTISTSGLVPQLKRFLHESNCALAVSLNATTDEVRNWIMPINRKYNLGMLLGALREELRLKHNYKVLFEYVMLAGVNDSIEDAKRLSNLVQGIPCKINLISFNPHSGSQFKPTSEEKIIEFRNVLAEAGCVVFLRLSRGDDQMAACGQLGKPGEIQPPLLRVPERFQMAV